MVHGFRKGVFFVFFLSGNITSVYKETLISARYPRMYIFTSVIRERLYEFKPTRIYSGRWSLSHWCKRELRFFVGEGEARRGLPPYPFSAYALRFRRLNHRPPRNQLQKCRHARETGRWHMKNRLVLRMLHMTNFLLRFGKETITFHAKMSGTRIKGLSTSSIVEKRLGLMSLVTEYLEKIWTFLKTNRSTALPQSICQWSGQALFCEQRSCSALIVYPPFQPLNTCHASWRASIVFPGKKIFFFFKQYAF